MKWRIWVPVILITAACVGAYAGCFRIPFIFDDSNAIVENPHLRRLWPLTEAMAAPAQASVDGRPVVSLSLALNYAVSGLNVWSYHALNLLAHVLAALLLYGITRRTLESDRLRGRFGAAAGALAGAIALLWAVHPLLTESVNYVVQRTELLMGLFFLATVYCVAVAHGSPHERLWCGAAVAVCALGMGSKEVMVTAPILVLLFDWVFLARTWRDLWHRRGLMYVGLALTWLVLAACLASGPRSETVGLGLSHVTPLDYARTQCGVIVHYLRLALWPQPLVLDYDDWRIAHSFVEVWPSMLIVGGLAGLSLFMLWRCPPLGFIGAWFFMILAPSSSVVPIVTEVAAERRMYLPLIAIVAVVVLGGWRLIENLCRGRSGRGLIGLGLAGVCATAMIVGTAIRTRDYRSDLSIWSDTVAKRPANARAHLNLGAALIAHGELDEAVRQFHEALALKPGYADAHFNLGVSLATQGRTDEARRQLTLAVQHDPSHANAQANLGMLLGRQGELVSATEHLVAAVRLNPAYAEAHNSLGSVLAMNGRLADAVPHFVAAIRLEPTLADAHYNLGIAEAQQGHRASAIEHLQAARRLDPGNERTRSSLESLLAPDPAVK